MKKIIIGLLTVITICLGCYLLYFRFKVGIVRFFDPDEFIYLNTAAHISMGYKPYVDYLFIMTPIYIFLLAPLFHFFQGVDYVMAGRISAYVISLLAYLSVGFLFWQTRKSFLAILVPVIFISLPMPSDKLMEIRPDTLAMVFFICGLILQIRKKEKKNTILLSGLFYGLSLLTCQKMYLGVVIAIFYYFIQRIWHRQKKISDLLPIIIGLSIPWGVFGIWSISSGDPGQVWYSIGKMAYETQTYNGFLHPTTPLLFFFLPNLTYYGSLGYDMGLIYNNALWILSSVICIFRLTEALVKRKIFTEANILIAAIYISFLIYYLYISPLKYPQYLIPASFFAAYFITDGIFILRQKLVKNRLSTILFTVFYLEILFIVCQVFLYTHNIKLTWTNKPNLAKIELLQKTIPGNEYVLDLEGRTISYKYPYYVCCYAIAQFAHSMSKPLPNLVEALEETKTKYIYQAEINRIDALDPREVRFIKENYTPTMDNELWVAKNW